MRATHLMMAPSLFKGTWKPKIPSERRDFSFFQFLIRFLDLNWRTQDCLLDCVELSDNDMDEGYASGSYS